MVRGMAEAGMWDLVYCRVQRWWGRKGRENKRRKDDKKYFFLLQPTRFLNLS
jgi:hypothetical protein